MYKGRHNIQENTICVLLTVMERTILYKYTVEMTGAFC